LDRADQGFHRTGGSVFDRLEQPDQGCPAPGLGDTAKLAGLLSDRRGIAWVGMKAP
jgi:hypothetical protein